MELSFFNLIAPPCIGAFIGYLTNKIAIRMLFRPLKPWYLFGFRVPMTPGVIPAKREALAENIGAMVGRHLLTSRDVGTALSAEPFQLHLAGVVERKVVEVMKKELDTIPTLIPKRFKAYFRVGVKTLKYRLAQGVHHYLAGEDFAALVQAIISQRLAQLGEQELNALVSPENREGLYAFVASLLAEALASDELEQWLASLLDKQLQQAADEGKLLGELVPAEVQTLIKKQLCQEGGTLLGALGRQMSSPNLRPQILSGIRQGVEHFLDSLGPVGAMARGFFEMETFEQKVDVYLSEQEDSLVAWLEGPELQGQMHLILEQKVDELFQRPLADLLNGLPEGQLSTLTRSLVGQLTGFMRHASLQQELASRLQTVCEQNVLQGGAVPIQGLIERLPGNGLSAIQQRVSVECQAILHSSRMEKMVRAMIETMVRAVLHKPIGRMFDLVPHGIRHGFAEYLVLTINKMLLQEVPGLVESLNIQRIVTEKVNGLDLLELEKLLLSIMEEQFKYINLFGALLGFLIGLLNLLALQVL